MSNLDKKYSLRLDLKFNYTNSKMKFDEFDKNTSDFFIRITRDKELIDISEAIVTLVAIKPDGSVDSQFVTINENNFYCDLKPSMKDLPGKYEAIASISFDGETVNTNPENPIVYEVTENKFLRQLSTEVVEEERFTILTDMINRLSVIENQENDRVEAETNRVESEKLRQQAIEKVKTDIAKLISDTNSKVDINLKENTAKIDTLVTDTNEKIDAYKTEKDEAIQQDLQQYKTDTTQDIDNYKNLKDSEIDKNLEDYKTTTTKNIDAYKNLKNTEIDNYKTEKDLEIDTYVVEKNKELDIYAAAKNAEINEYKDLKDTLINDKLREVDTAEQSRTEAETLRQQQHTERENFLNGFESQLGQIETDINDLKNNGTGGNANIDDTQVSTDTTWSSDKISTWSMEQDGVFWTKKEDNFISADDTYEYKLREVEIFGDTWQDSDSKNLVLFDASLFNDSDISKITVEKEGTISFTNSNLVSTKDIQLSPNTEYTIHAIQTTVSGDAPYNLIRIYENNSQIATVVSSKNYTKFTTSDTGVIKISFFTKSGTWTNEITKYSDLMIFKGADNIKYEPYHKADLSNIQHAGELYIDEEGQPILDSEGREQYKFEIESCNANLWDVSKMKIPENWDGVWKTNLNTSNFNLRYGETYYFDVGVRVFFKKNSSKVLEIAVNTKQFATIPDYDEVSFDAYIPGMTLEQYKEKLKNGYITTGNAFLPVVIPHKSHKQTILLPCQLMKVGDVKDRLFWDESKGRYVVEKNVDMLLKNEYTLSIANHQNTSTHQGFDIKLKSKKVRPSTTWLIGDNKILARSVLLNDTLVGLFEGVPTNLSVITDYLNSNNIKIYFVSEIPQLIETNITTPITIPTYNNKTHVYVVNGNNAKASIKAKFPLKTASAVATLNVENDKNSKDINKLQDSNVDLIGANFEIDFRLSEVEWTLEDAGLATPVTASLKNIKLGGNTMALTRFEQAKILILAGEYDKERMTYQLTRYLERGYIKQTEYDELIALMEAKELVTGE